MKKTVRIVLAGLAALVLLIGAAPVIQSNTGQHTQQHYSDTDHPEGG